MVSYKLYVKPSYMVYKTQHTKKPHFCCKGQYDFLEMSMGCRKGIGNNLKFERLGPLFGENKCKGGRVLT